MGSFSCSGAVSSIASRAPCFSATERKIFSVTFVVVSDEPVATRRRAVASVPRGSAGTYAAAIRWWARSSRAVASSAC